MPSDRAVPRALAPPGLVFSATHLNVPNNSRAQVFIPQVSQFYIASPRICSRLPGQWYSPDCRPVSLPVYPSFVCASAFYVQGHCVLMCSRFPAVSQCHQYFNPLSFDAIIRIARDGASRCTLRRSILHQTTANRNVTPEKQNPSGNVSVVILRH
ncbi:hypothetical protein EDB85DRAFT_1923131 [Lactarius pseudohatsudake]|nr:hypothetical protein EDB85DRAFT_1923131 [Lactarius pseudohatsudake]